MLSILFLLVLVIGIILLGANGANSDLGLWYYKIRISILCQFLCLRKITLVTTTVKNPKKVKRFCFYVVGC